MKTVAIIQARLGSKRLPEKILEQLDGRSMLEQIVRRCNAADRVDEVAVAVPAWEVEKIFNATGIACHGGPEDDVLTRLLDVAIRLKADKMVRVTADNALVDPDLMDQMIGFSDKAPIVTNTIPRTYPNGMDLEVWDVAWMRDTLSPALHKEDREWFYSWCVDNLGDHAFNKVMSDYPKAYKYRLTVDYEEDMDVIRKIYEAQAGAIWTTKTIITWLDAHPVVRLLNLKYAKEMGDRPK